MKPLLLLLTLSLAFADPPPTTLRPPSLPPFLASSLAQQTGQITALNSNLAGGVPSPRSTVFTTTGPTLNTLAVSVEGSYAATLVVQSTVDNVHWYTVPSSSYTKLTDGSTGAIAGAGIWTVPVTGMYERVTCSAYTSGSAAVTLIPFASSGGALGAATGTVGTAGGVTTAYVNASLSNSAAAVKASAGNVYDVTCANPDASSEATIEIFNVAAGSVTVGTTTPAWYISLAPGQRQNLSFAVPRSCGTAISIAAVQGHLLSGSTAPATAVNVCVGYN
ncbi:MAG TPA: hypothetical protein VKT78_13560 [Fimbriimonadaceae bacterium]|nr:hypothetical protein [Fimbriimonadaceae bacterium]